MADTPAEPDWDTLDCEPWEQLPAETAKAFALFTVYRDLDPADRSLRAMARQLDRSGTNLGRYSASWWWQERCRRWDRHLDRIAQRRLEELRADRVEAHQKIAAQALHVITQRLVGDDAAGVVAIDPNDITISELIRCLDVATRVERTALGEPDQKVEHSGPEGGPISVEVEPDPQVSAALASLLETARQPAPDDLPAENEPCKRAPAKKAGAKKKRAG
jgi:hypothetical protein